MYTSIYRLLCYYFTSLTRLRSNCAVCDLGTKIHVTPLLYKETARVKLSVILVNFYFKCTLSFS